MLATFESTSRILSADQSCTITMVLTALVNIHTWLTKMAARDDMGQDLKKLASDLAAGKHFLPFFTGISGFYRNLPKFTDFTVISGI